MAGSREPGNKQGTGMDESASNVDELFDSLGLNERAAHSQNDHKPEKQGTTSARFRNWLPLAGVLGVGLVLALGALLFGRSSDPEVIETAAAEDSSDDSAADETATEAAVSGDDALEAEAEKLRGVLSRLGLPEVDIEVSDGTIQLTGTVPSEQDLSAIRNAVVSSADPNTIDMRGIEIGGPASGQQAAPNQPPPPGQAPPPPPGSPPPGFAQPTDEQRANLQGELERVLANTPLVFDVGSTELNELQLEVLDTVIRPLLEGHPGVPIRLVGYTDGTGSAYDNDRLSLARANAVRDYLISTSVPEFIVRAEGRGETNSSGEDGKDRRVEIEVVNGP